MCLKKEYNNAAQLPGARPPGPPGGGYGGGPGRGSGGGGDAPRLLSGDLWYGQQAFRALNQVRYCSRQPLTATHIRCLQAPLD